MVSPRADRRPPSLVVVAALPAEARPIIDHYGLTPRGDGRPFRIFSSVDQDLSLAISGAGKTAAAAAATRVCQADETIACLNVGIAGHATRPIGAVCLAHRVVDDVSGTSWYPPLVFAPPCPTATVRTVARPCTSYPDDSLYDMEAAGIVDAAARVMARELVHSIKVVSDNRDNPASNLTADRVHELVRDALPIVTSTIDSLLALAAEEISRRAEPTGFAAILGTAHFSTTRRRQLRRQLRRWASLDTDNDPVAWLGAHCDDDAGQIVQALRQRLDGVAPRLGDGR